MLRAIVIFIVVAVALLLLLSLGGFAGPIEFAVVLVIALAAEIIARCRTRKR